MPEKCWKIFSRPGAYLTKKAEGLKHSKPAFAGIGSLACSMGGMALRPLSVGGFRKSAASMRYLSEGREIEKLAASRTEQYK